MFRRNGPKNAPAFSALHMFCGSYAAQATDGGSGEIPAAGSDRPDAGDCLPAAIERDLFSTAALFAGKMPPFVYPSGLAEL